MRKAASKRPTGAGRRPPPRRQGAALKQVLKKRFVQPRPWKYIAVCLVGGSAVPESASVKKNDRVFWVNWDERPYTLTFLADSPFVGGAMTIVVPAKEPGANGNFGIAGPFQVRNDADTVKHQYQPTAVGWSGPPDPPDIDVGG